MDGKDLEIVSYILIQKLTMDMLFMFAVYLTMVYVAAERTELDGEEENNNTENLMVENESDDSDVSLSITETLPIVASGEQGSSGNLVSGLAGMTNVFSTYIKTSERLINILVQRLGSDHDASEGRRRVNGELMKLPGLSVRDRLRAATLIVSNQNKVDLLFSLPDDIKRQYVTMLLDNVF